MGKWLEAERNTLCVKCRASIETGQRFWWARRGTYMCELCGSIAEHELPETGELENGVLRDLALLPPEASEGSTAKMMLFYAKRLDCGDVADRDVAPMTKELRQLLVQIKLEFPVKAEDDDTEKARKRRMRMLLNSGDFGE